MLSVSAEVYHPNQLFRSETGRTITATNSESDRVGAAQGGARRSRREIVFTIIRWLAPTAIGVGLVLRFRQSLAEVVWPTFSLILVAELCVVSLILNILVSALKFWLLYRRLGMPIPFREVFFLDLSAASASIILPAKSEMFFMAAYLTRRGYCSFLQAVGTTVYHLVTSLLAVFFLLAIFAPLVIPLSAGLGLVGAVAILAIFFLAPAAVRNFGPRRFRGDAAGLPRGSIQIWLFLLSLGCAAATPVLLALLFHALKIDARWPAIVFHGNFVELLSQLPVAIAGAGIREASVLYLFRGTASPGDLLVCGAIITGVSRLLPAAIGLLFVRRITAVIVGGSKEDRARADQAK